MEKWQHYNVWQAFNERIYRQTLTFEHILKNGNEMFVESVVKLDKLVNGDYQLDEKYLVNQKCIHLEKDGVKYLLPTQFKQHLPLNIKQSVDCFLKKSDTTIYKLILEPKTANIRGEKFYSFKEFIHRFNPMESTLPKVWTFLKLQAIGSCSKGCKYRLCSIPSLGKNSNDTILRSITNKVVRVSKPTLAKLETLFYYNQKVIPDEMTSLGGDKIKEVEPFILNIADETPEFEKHSMAQTKSMNTVNVANSSCIFTYNKIENLSQGSKFFDDIWQNIDAINDRYPALLLPDGKITDKVPKLSKKQASDLLDEHFEDMRRLVKTGVHYIDNLTDNLHGYDRSRLQLRFSRHYTNMEGVVDAIDVFSDTEVEFNEWIDFINKCVSDYVLMIKDRDGEVNNMFASPIIVNKGKTVTEWL